MKLSNTLKQLFSILLLAPAAQAMELKIPNPTITPRDAPAVNMPAQAKQWKQTAGTEKSCLKWVGTDAKDLPISHTLMLPGATLVTEVDVPILTDREAQAKGKWTGLLSLDLLGTVNVAVVEGEPKGEAEGEAQGEGEAQAPQAQVQGVGSCKLEVYEVKSGKLIASVTGKTKYSARQADPKLSRVWEEISAETMTSLQGKKIELRLSSIGTAASLVSGVSMSRLIDFPQGNRLFGRANGGRGPDILGAGSLGFTGFAEDLQSVLIVFNVKKGGPADRAGLKAGDKIVGVNQDPFPANSIVPGWRWFYHSHEAVLGRAVVAAWSPNPPVGKGRVRLVVLRNGKPVPLMCQLSRRMDFRDIANSKDKDIMHAQMIDYVCKTQRPDGSWGKPFNTYISALALLSTGDKAHAARIKKTVDWSLNKYPEPDSLGGFWHASYAGIFYCEYYLATGDKRMLPHISSILEWIRSGAHTSKWGMLSLGHGPRHLPYNQKSLVAPAAHVLVFDSLAEKCGISSGLWDMLMPYIEISWSNPKHIVRKRGANQPGHGGMGYSAALKDVSQAWSRTGLVAMAAHLRGKRPDMENAMVAFMEKYYTCFRNSHGYGEPGGALGLLALSVCKPASYDEVIKAYGWWFALAWEPGFGLRYTTPHMGSPYMGDVELINPAYALVLAAPRKNLFITGGDKRNWLNISNLDTPLSEVIIRRGKTGKITLSCRVPGPEIRYTLDGSAPKNNSTVYKEPIDLPNGGTIKARAYKTSLESSENVATATFGPSKAGWKVIAASGHKDPIEARRRASYAIDHSLTHKWLTDVGQDAKGYPHHIVIDLGGEKEVKAVTVWFGRDVKLVRAGKLCVVKGSLKLEEEPKLLASGSWRSYQSKRRILLPKVTKLRYLRLEIRRPMDRSSVALGIREIDVE